jgi:cell volume regulation protein A
LFVGLIIGIGFIAMIVFRKTGISDVLLLVFVGALLGQLLSANDKIALDDIASVFSALAITVILFEGGMNLNIRRVIEDSPTAGLIAIISFILSSLLITLFVSVIFEWDILKSLLLGSILGGSSSAIVIPLLMKLSISAKITTVLTLESAFTDALSIVISLSLVNFLIQTPDAIDAQPVIQNTLGSFSVGAILGFAVGLLWLRILKSLADQPYDDILTLSTVILLYGVAEFGGGSGAIAALVFGLILGNGVEIGKMLGNTTSVQASDVMRKFQSQMSFLIRTFFFVFLGIVVQVSNPLFIIAAISITFIIIASRFITVRAVVYKQEPNKSNITLMTFMLPRGLAAAVLSQLPEITKTLGYTEFPEITLLVVILTIIVSTVSIFFISKHNRN